MALNSSLALASRAVGRGKPLEGKKNSEHIGYLGWVESSYRAGIEADLYSREIAQSDSGNRR